jgi:tryptophan 2,3-dioxygenase
MAARPTDYELYLRVPELLSLQKSADRLACSDELLFQIIHQSAELWMKLVDHEMRHLAELLDATSMTEATVALHRVHGVQKLLAEGLELLYTLSPADYISIRAVLGRGSGQESPGFRRMLALPGELWPHFARLLERMQIQLVELYRHPHRHAELYALAEGLTEFDLRLQEWRNRHILLVYRTIGVGTPSLKGKHSELLERGLRTQFFPELWAVRDQVFAEWTAEHPYGAKQSLSQPEVAVSPLPSGKPLP